MGRWIKNEEKRVDDKDDMSWMRETGFQHIIYKLPIMVDWMKSSEEGHGYYSGCEGD